MAKKSKSKAKRNVADSAQDTVEDTAPSAVEEEVKNEGEEGSFRRFLLLLYFYIN